MQKNYTYTGSEQTVTSGATLNHTETTLVYSNNTFTDVGTSSYTVKITAAETANYKATEATVVISVAKATATIDTNSVQKSYTYTGSEQAVTSGAILNHTETTLVYSDNTFTDVGTGSYTVKITAAETANYKAAEATVVISVAKATVAVPTPAVTEFTYTGAPITLFVPEDDAKYTAADTEATEVGSHTVTLTLKDTENHVWSNPDFDGCLTFSIVAAEQAE